MKKIIVIFFAVVIIVSTPNLFAQDELAQQFNLAKNLYANENYYDAITELKRLIFFDADSQYTFDAYYMIGKSYKMGDKFSDAILNFTNAEMNAKTIQQIFEAKVEIIRANILRRTTGRALDLLNDLKKDKSFSSKTNDINYWRGWAFMFEDKWQKAAESFSKIDSCKQLQNLAEQVEKDKYSETFSNLISHFIPGAGQIYTGHYFSGFLSLGWNVLWGYVTVNSFAANRIFDGLVELNLLWLRFYNGNIQNAQNFAKEENIKITDKALSYLQFQYQGLKP
ncbi:MAG: hypothetical protein ACYCVH_10200 [Ignavibacteriaceae bacterium]